MSNLLPTFLPKIDRVTQSGNPQNLVVANDINQIYNCLVDLYSKIGTLAIRKVLTISASSFTASYYTNSLLVNLQPDIDFQVYTNEGSGTLLVWDNNGTNYEGGYSYTPALGRLTLNPGNYSIQVFTPVNVS